ncbi:hypothetical protein [Pseudomonas aeruginosa]|uniref:hypothetical protein n=1 Tax=Pseudomonas aeruginosa TaxID=287 RepID=UPI00036795E1|nr:hypothetical protein [Pseudomonas aeruginosa]EKU1368048.1 hypothetical protein [Pseudomonas aeruginosa]NTT49736.1 hypothetical protein [Pseudomonas aeruginosa]WPM38997.1 hypothetical protein N8A97_13760 [Pseudomonas aeruginosa]HCF4597805.1 hypothetical protein [Pseudomonas aeruginosa]
MKTVTIGRAARKYGSRPVLLDGVKVAEVSKVSSCWGSRYLWILKRDSDGKTQQCTDLDHVRSIARTFE